MAPFHSLDAPSLKSLALALRGGTLGPPTPASLHHHCPGELAPALADTIANYQARGFSGAQLADVLDLLRADRARASHYFPGLDLVWSGPEADQFVDRDPSVVVMELFQNAKKSVLISSFILWNGKALFEPLHRRMVDRPGLDVKMFLNIKRSINDSRSPGLLIEAFAQEFRTSHWVWEDYLPKVYFDPRSLSTDQDSVATLHAKVVVVDDTTALITSANLTPRAQNKNIEAGVRIDSGPFTRTVTQQFLGLIEANLVQQLPL